MSIVLAALALLLASPVPPQDPGKDEGKLKKFGKPYKEDAKDQGDGRGRKNDGPGMHFRSDDDDDEDSGDDELLDVALQLALYPVFDHDLRFQDYPYSRGRCYFRKHQHFEYLEETEEKMWSADLRLQAGYVDHDTSFYGASGSFRWASGGDFRFDVTQYRERFSGADDRLTLQEYELNYGLGPVGGNSRSVQATLGWGVGVLDLQDFTDAGLSLQSNVLWFPGFNTSLRAHAGFIAFSSATLADLQLEAGYHVGRFAFTLGVRSLLNNHGEDLTGPMVGAAIFF